MLYSLPNGKVIEMSVEQYLDITDEDFEYLISINYGESVENPFFGSIISHQSPVIPDDTPEEPDNAVDIPFTDE